MADIEACLKAWNFRSVRYLRRHPEWAADREARLAIYDDVMEYRDCVSLLWRLLTLARCGMFPVDEVVEVFKKVGDIGMLLEIFTQIPGSISHEEMRELIPLDEVIAAERWVGRSEQPKQTQRMFRQALSIEGYRELYEVIQVHSS